MEWGKPSLCLDLSNAFGLVSKENRAYSVTQSTHICLFTCFCAAPVSFYTPQWYFWSYQLVLTTFKKNIKVLMIIAIPLVVQKLVDKKDTNAFPCWGGGGQSSARAAAVPSAPTYQPMQLAHTVPCVSYRALSLLDIVEPMENSGLLRWENMGGLRYKSVASQALLVWLHTLQKQLLYPKLSQYMKDVPLSLEKCHVPEKYQCHWKTQDMLSVLSALRQMEEKIAGLQQSSNFGIGWSRDIKF